MMKPGALHVSPKTLVYPLASKDVSVCTSILRLENKDASQLVAFKVKTTAVKRYVVRPNVGILLPGKSVEVQVLLNYDRARLEGVDLAAVHDRFQVLSAVVDATASEQLLDLWAKTPDEALSKTLVKCKFVDPALVKTVTPVAASPGAAAAAAAAASSSGASSPATPQLQSEPDMLQAKSIFKQEMANSKAKQEAKTMRTERDAALAALKVREEEIASLKSELAAARSRSGGGGNVGKGVLGRLFGAIWFFVLYLLIVAMVFVLCYKVLDYDPIRAFSNEFSLRVLERRFKIAIQAFLKS